MERLTNMLGIAGERITKNLALTLTELSAERWIKFVIVVGGYLLLRPFLASPRRLVLGAVHPTLWFLVLTKAMAHCR